MYIYTYSCMGRVCACTSVQLCICMFAKNAPAPPPPPLPEGTLHHIGEEIIHSMHRITSTSHATLHEHDTTGPGERPEGSTAPPSYPHNGGQRDSVVPLMEEVRRGRGRVHTTWRVSHSRIRYSMVCSASLEGVCNP